MFPNVLKNKKKEIFVDKNGQNLFVKSRVYVHIYNPLIIFKKVHSGIKKKEVTE